MHRQLHIRRHLPLSSPIQPEADRPVLPTDDPLRVLLAAGHLPIILTARALDCHSDGIGDAAQIPRTFVVLTALMYNLSE
jgi:hypothetical protein